MNFRLRFTDEAKAHLEDLESDPSKDRILKSVRKALGLMETNLRHPGLKTHKYSSLHGPNEEEVFEAHAQNQTSRAYRIFWYYGPRQGEISIVAIVPHPE